MSNEKELEVLEGEIQNETSLVAATDKEEFSLSQQLQRLTPGEKKQVTALKKTIDFSSTSSLMNYGSQVINKRASVSESILEKYKNKDIGEIGEIVTSLVTDLRSYDIDNNEKGIFRIFKKAKNKIENIRTQYEKADKSVKIVTGKLEGEIITLTNDINMLDKMYQNNLEKF